jgi:predicted acyl esterase
VEQGTPWLLQWLQEQRDGPYWRHGSLRPNYERITCATMIVGGWADGYRNNSLRTFAALRAPKALLMGPWSHMSTATSLPGPHLDLVPEMIRWFGRWLRDERNGVDDRPSDPPVARRHGLAEHRATADPR